MSEIERAAEVLRAGGLVIFPTETVYGVGCDATNAEAVARLYAAKGIRHSRGRRRQPLAARPSVAYRKPFAGGAERRGGRFGRRVGDGLALLAHAD